MSSKAHTKEEKFLLALYHLHLTSEEEDFEIDLFDLGEGMQMQPRLIKSFMQNLTQANFVKKINERTVRMTQRGIDVAEELSSRS